MTQPVRMSMRRFIVGAALLTGAVAPTAAAQQPHEITSVPAGNARRYVVAVGQCREHTCQIMVELRDRSRRLDRYVLPVGARSTAFESRALDVGDGFGGPLTIRAGTLGWYAGNEEDEMVLAVSPFRLAPEQMGILIVQRFGFEHIKRKQLLLGTRGDRLFVLWKGDDGAGPTSSTVVIGNITESRQSLLYYAALYNGDDHAPDRLSLRALAYDPQSHAMIPYQRQLTALIVGPFTTLAAARAQQSAQRECSRGLLVLPATQLGGAAGKFALGSIVDSADAAAALDSSRTHCSPAARVARVAMKKGTLSF